MRRFRLTQEPFVRSRLGRSGWMQKLQSDSPLEPSVLGLEHGSHSAETQETQDTEIGDATDFVRRLRGGKYSFEIG